MADEGYIAISRKLFNNPIWTDKREFSRAEAWIDLIQTAAWKDGNRLLIEGQMISWGRGQVAASIRFLKNRWGWASNGKITRFLKMLTDEQMITINTEQAVSVITLCKYEDYNIKISNNGTPAEQQRNSNGTQAEQNRSNSSKVNKISKEGSIDERKVALRTLIEPYLAKYGNEMCNKFYSYWTELNRKNKDKMRIDDQDYFDVGKRLATWNSNNTAKDQKKDGLFGEKMITVITVEHPIPHEITEDRFNKAAPGHFIVVE